MLVLLVNQSFRLPTMQQWMSLLFYMLTEISWFLQARLILQ